MKIQEKEALVEATNNAINAMFASLDSKISRTSVQLQLITGAASMAICAVYTVLIMGDICGPLWNTWSSSLVMPAAVSLLLGAARLSYLLTPQRSFERWEYIPTMIQALLAAACFMTIGN